MGHNLSYKVKRCESWHYLELSEYSTLHCQLPILHVYPAQIASIVVYHTLFSVTSFGLAIQPWQDVVEVEERLLFHQLISYTSSSNNVPRSRFGSMSNWGSELKER